MKGIQWCSQEIIVYTAETQTAHWTICEPQQKQSYIGQHYWYKYPSANISMYAEAREICGHAPPGIFDFHRAYHCIHTLGKV